MPFLRLEIERFVDDLQPGLVAGTFADAQGVRHTIIDKVPVIAFGDVSADSSYPQSGVAACEVLGQWLDGQQRGVARITIERPWSLNSTNGEAEFVVLQSQIAEEVDSCR